MEKVDKNNKKLPSDKKSRTTNQERMVEIACKNESQNALRVLFRLMNDEKLEPRWRIQCAKEVLDRGWGRPAQQIKADINIMSVDKLVDALKGA